MPDAKYDAAHYDYENVGFTTPWKLAVGRIVNQWRPFDAVHYDYEFVEEP